MTISRRPKSRASTEYNPGPIIASASEIAITSKDATLQSTNLAGSGSNHDVELARMPQATSMLATGVANPTNTQKPHGRRTMAFARDTQFDHCVRHKYPWQSAKTPTIARSSSSATADQPFGKLERQGRTRLDPLPGKIAYRKA